MGWEIFLFLSCTSFKNCTEELDSERRRKLVEVLAVGLGTVEGFEGLGRL